MKKQDVLNSVLNSVSSIFSKEDVIRLIESIEVGVNINEVQLEEALSAFTDNLERAANNNALVVWNTAEFELRGNEITLENVDVEIDEIVGMARGIFEEMIETSL